MHPRASAGGVLLESRCNDLLPDANIVATHLVAKTPDLREAEFSEELCTSIIVLADRALGDARPLCLRAIERVGQELFGVPLSFMVLMDGEMQDLGLIPLHWLNLNTCDHLAVDCGRRSCLSPSLRPRGRTSL